MAPNSGPIPPLPGTGSSAQSQTPDSNFKELYSFKGKPDAAEPFAPLTPFQGAFYGMTAKGGKENRGTIFRITPDGKETLLLSFTGEMDDGANPSSGLVALDGTLYGLTEHGGASNLGTFFSLNSDGTPHLLYSFEQQGGVHPTGGLLAADGVFYGTANTGGNYNAGTVYEITTAGEYHLLYNFAGDRTMDAVRKAACDTSIAIFTVRRLTVARTTTGSSSGFRMTDPKGDLQFWGHGYGRGRPPSGLTAISGALYGTTLLGGAKGVGTIYEVKPGGGERVIYSLALKSGFAPYVGLLNQNNLLYGTASDGGRTEPEQSSR
ncbi:MAG TPA: choice-of-anchor tandem repeat GloVer-containing protein [Candidatus Cybelea sp.]|nr:choice-of-anchor tandem repeat GloVer-containing protein [Candidatus Cybelea sp.]